MCPAVSGPEQGLAPNLPLGPDRVPFFVQRFARSTHVFFFKNVHMPEFGQEPHLDVWTKPLRLIFSGTRFAVAVSGLKNFVRKRSGVPSTTDLLLLVSHSSTTQTLAGSSSWFAARLSRCLPCHHWDQLSINQKIGGSRNYAKRCLQIHLRFFQCL